MYLFRLEKRHRAQPGHLRLEQLKHVTPIRVHLQKLIIVTKQLLVVLLGKQVKHNQSRATMDILVMELLRAVRWNNVYTYSRVPLVK